MNSERAKVFAAAVLDLVKDDPSFFKENGELNAAALSRFVGIPQPTVFRNLTARTEPSETTIAAFAKAFGVSPARFRGESEALEIRESASAYLSSDEAKLLESYSRLPVTGKKIIGNLAKTMAELRELNDHLGKLLDDANDDSLENLISAAVIAIYTARRR